MRQKDVLSTAETVLNFINTERKRVFPRAAGYRPTPSNLRLIQARLAEGYSESELKAVYMFCIRDDFLRKYADYTTPFRAAHFGKYLDRALARSGGETGITFAAQSDTDVDDDVLGAFR